MLLPPDIARKIEWAEELLRTLDQRVTEYAAQLPLQVHAERGEPVGDNQVEWHVVSRIAHQVPSHLALLAGDVIQNTRAVLDYLARALVQARGGTPVDRVGGTQFPILLQRPSKGVHLAGCTDATILDRLESVQPFNSASPSEHPLAQLHALNNINKHQTLPVLVGAGGVPAVISLHSGGRSPVGVVVPFMRWFFEGERLFPAMFHFLADVTPVAEGTIETVVALKADAWHTVAMVDELDYYLRHVRDVVIPEFRDFFDSPWPGEVFQSHRVPDPREGLPEIQPAQLVEMVSEVRNRVSNGNPSSRLLVVSLLPGVSAAMGYHTGGTPLSGFPGT